jgi:hypothetical protein
MIVRCGAADGLPGRQDRVRILGRAAVAAIDEPGERPGGEQEGGQLDGTDDEPGEGHAPSRRRRRAARKMP